MEWKAEDEAIARRYLLGELPDDERQRFEERMMTDGQSFDRVVIIEEELVEDYVRNVLTPNEREKLERNFLSTSEGRDRVRLITALRKGERDASETAPLLAVARVTQQLPPAPYLHSGTPIRTYALAAMALVMLCGCLWLAVKTYQYQREIGRLQAVREATSEGESQIEKELRELRQSNETLREELEREKKRIADLEKEADTLRAQSRQAGGNAAQPIETIATITLTPGSLRGDGRKKLNLGKRITRVGLSLSVPMEQYKNYSAVILKERDEIWSGQIETARRTNKGKSVELNLPADLFTNGVYIVSLTGTKPDGTTDIIGKYYFKVEKE